MSNRPPRRALVVGATGLLGSDVVVSLRSAGWHVTAATRGDLDITDREACVEAVRGHDVVVNTAAFTSVDDAESHEDVARAVNAGGAENLALASASVDAVFVQYSTDYVFSGSEPGPYREDSPLSPINAYGRTKADAERLILTAYPDGSIIIRTAWLYGSHGPNFVKTIVRRYRESGTLTVVDDQFGQPTWTRDLAEQTLRMLDTGMRSGLLHGTNAGATTWFGFAQAIVENLGGSPDSVEPTDSARFARPARRPTNSVLGHDGWARIGLTPMRPWRAALDEAMAEGGFE